MINVLIIEDQRMMRETMETYITQTEGYHLAGSFPAASDAERFCALNPVDLILMDVVPKTTKAALWPPKTSNPAFQTSK